MGRSGSPAREISFVSLVAYGPKVSDSALTMGVTASETRQGGSHRITSTENSSVGEYELTMTVKFISSPSTGMQV